MAGTFQVNQPTTGKTTVRFQWSADTIKVQAIVGNFAELLHKRGKGPTDANGQIPFANLTNQQKLNMVDEYLLQIIVDTARQRRLDLALETAKDGVLATPVEDQFD